MSNDFNSLREDRSDTNIDDLEDFYLEGSIEGVKEEAKPSSRTHTSVLVSSVGGGAKQLNEYIKKLGPATSPLSFDENWLGLFGIQEIIRSEIREIIHSEFRQPPETRWVQNLQHASYQFRQPIPFLIEREGGVVTATYDDVDLRGTGESVKEATSELCAKIVVRYEELRESAAKSQEYVFLKRIIEEIEPPAWQELKQLYKEKLKEIPYVQEGYIKIDGNNAEIVIVLSEESVEIIMELAEIDLEINQEFRSLSFSVEYESSEDYLELDDFECFY